MSLWYLVQDWHPEVKETSASILSLTPAVSYQLDRLQRPYKILTDFCDENQLRQNEENYFHEQLDWANRIDEELQKQEPLLKEKGIRPCFYQFSKLKYLIDTWTIFSIRLLAFIKEAKPSEIMYVWKKQKMEGEEFSVYHLKKTISNAFLLLIEEAARQQGISLKIRQLEEESRAELKPAGGKSWKQALKDVLKPGYNFFRYSKNLFLSPSAKNVLMLDAGNPSIDYVIQKFFKNGCRVFFKSGQKIKNLSSFAEGETENYESAYQARHTEWQERMQKAAQKILSQPWFWASLQKKAGLDLRPAVTPFLESFFTSSCASMAAEYDFVHRFFSTNKIDLVAARASSGKNYPAVLNAAANLGVRTACFMHGCGTMRLMDWLQGELAYFNFSVTTDSLTEEAFKTLTEESWSGECAPLQSSHFLRSVPVQTSKAEKVLLFVPNKSFLWTRKFNTLLYDAAWHYQFLKALVDFWGTRKDWKIIYKHHAAFDWAPSSILKYIADRGYSNIEVGTGSLQSYFNSCSRVLTDFPSTPFFETIAAGIPTLSLYPESIVPLPEMSAYFGPALQSFTDIPDALRKTESFMNNPAENYPVSIPLNPSDDFIQPLLNPGFGGAASYISIDKGEENRHNVRYKLRPEIDL